MSARACGNCMYWAKWNSLKKGECQHIDPVLLVCYEHNTCQQWQPLVMDRTEQ